MNIDITFCNNRKCNRIECLRYYKNAPYNVLLSWSDFIKKNENSSGKDCKYYIC